MFPDHGDSPAPACKQGFRQFLATLEIVVCDNIAVDFFKEKTEQNERIFPLLKFLDQRIVVADRIRIQDQTGTMPDRTGDGPLFVVQISPVVKIQVQTASIPDRFVLHGFDGFLPDAAAGRENERQRLGVRLRIGRILLCGQHGSPVFYPADNLLVRQ
ncbi:hypothetical protein SDC9_166123 [bioreactor metagenome]|uniref:Uncharacterized protein n=1 Tax=bioreactor metagenome TaxID=1076179 RepID=A0A645FYP0_9ZZZZ